MELVLKTPRQRWIYQNIWPHPGSRFGNDWADAHRWDKLKWLHKTWAQQTGFSPEPVNRNWRDTTPWVRDEADRIEYENRKAGIDELFLPADFIDRAAQTNVPDETDTCVSGAFGSLKGKSNLEKYIVIVLAIIAGILILKIIL
jgi:hypothetical protein